MNDGRLALSQIALLLAYAGGMAGGQLLFKAAALRYAPDAPLGERLLGVVANSYFLGAVVLYGSLTVLWVWVLTFTPLSRAYPFVALAFAITPLLGGLVFGEPIAPRLLFGIALILGGLLLVASGAWNFFRLWSFSLARQPGRIGWNLSLLRKFMWSSPHITKVR